jgi:UDP:flavonoid glycosyltransferase YjiC (YdhE family)
MRCVLTTFGSLGDLHPYIAIALELQRRGHEAVIATSAHFREKVEGEGIGFAAVRPNIPDLGESEEVIKKIFDLRRGPECMICEMIMPHLRASYEDLTAAVQGADFLLNHMAVFAGPLVAEKQKLMWAASVLAPLSFFSAHDPPVLPLMPGMIRLRGCGPGLHAQLFRAMKFMTRSWTQPVRELRREIGLLPSRLDPLYEGQFSPTLNLALFSSILAVPQPDWPPNTVATGFPFYDRHDNEPGMSPDLSAFLDAGPAPIVFTLGSAAVMDAGSFFAESVEAARELGHRAVLLIGPDPRNRPKAGLPQSIAAFEYAPFSALFPRAAAIVHQGGVGTTGQALRAGRPMLVVPYGFDQPDNAERVVRLGVAKTISRSRYSAKPAMEALSALLSNPVYRRKAEEIGRIVRQEQGASMACDHLLRLDPHLNPSQH